jgi:hypothetical protein
MILCSPSQFFDFLTGFRPLTPARNSILSYTQSSFPELLTPFNSIAVALKGIGLDLPKRVVLSLSGRRSVDE